MIENLLNDSMVYDILKALTSKGEYSYDQDGLKITASKNDNGLNFHCTYSLTEDNKKEADEAREEFYRFCNTIDNDLFIRTCESIDLKAVNDMVNDDEDYQEGIDTFIDALQHEAQHALCDITDRLHDLEAEQDQLMERKNELKKYLTIK